jgi:hypothetical protein
MREETRLQTPERRLLNTHKQFMAPHEPVYTKDTCSAKNFQYGLKRKFEIPCARRSRAAQI